LGLPAVICAHKPSVMTKISYAGYRFPPVIIQQAVWLYARFTLSFRDVEDLLAERGGRQLIERECGSSRHNHLLDKRREQPCSPFSVEEARRMVWEQKGRIIRLREAGRDTWDAQRVLLLLEANLQKLREHKQKLERDGLIAA
jgi:hypothetical protein